MRSTPRCKYQIFISSTFEDLREEREHVSWEILKMRHIPAGMESFTAKDERGWRTIQRTIDDSDYYVIILAGRYGSIDSEWDQSWTQHEYEYARTKGIPILAFIRDMSAIPADRLDADRTRIDNFKSLIKQKHLYSTWKQKDDLAKAVSTALTTQITDDLDETRQRPGWYRGDALPGPSPEIAEEIARLSAENNRLRRALEELQASKIAQLEVVDSQLSPLSEYKYECEYLSLQESHNDSIFATMSALGTPKFGLFAIQRR